MKDENEFNARFSKQIKLMGSSFAVDKNSDRFRLGVADFAIYHQGLALSLESKFVKTLPKKGDAKVLKHPISGAQITYLKRMQLAGVRAGAIVGVLPYKKIVVVPMAYMATNWTLAEFEKLCQVCSKYDFSDVSSMVKFLFNARSIDYLT